jgi:hypothetical protein
VLVLVEREDVVPRGVPVGVVYPLAAVPVPLCTIQSSASLERGSELRTAIGILDGRPLGGNGVSEVRLVGAGLPHQYLVIASR